MNRCKDCCYFDFGSPYLDHGLCRLIGHEEYSLLAFTADFEGYASNLHVMPEFGCVLWEPKPK